MDHASLSGGFANPPHQSATAFRGIMRAMACPGTIHNVPGATPPSPVSEAAGTTLLTLCDHDTGVHLAGAYNTQAVRDWITFQTGAPLVNALAAQFVLGSWPDIDLSALAIGTAEYPDRSATVIVEMQSLQAQGATLRGPGIKDTAVLNLPGLAPFRRNAALFPLGLDFIFTCGEHIAAVTRSTRVS